MSKCTNLGFFGLFVLGCLSLAGCASLTNPVADGVPVRRLPPEMLATPKSDKQNLPLSLLRQKQPEVYRLDGGDILGIYVEGVLGEKGKPPPVNVSSESGLPASIGYPVVVHQNGTITLPLIDPVNVRGMSLEQAQTAIRKQYVEEQKVLLPDNKFIVTLQKRRTYHVLVVRQDTSGGTATTTTSGFGIGSIGVAAGTTGKGTGFSLDLPAYENDVMNALAKTGGLPGFDAEDEVIIERGAYRDNLDPASMTQSAANCSSADRDAMNVALGVSVVRIPLRMKPNELPTFSPEDVILRSGDIVFIRSRDTQVFYTAGLLFAGQYQLPRDYDIGVVEAIAFTRGTLVNGGLNSLNNFTGSSFGGTIGAPNPSEVDILRRTPNGGQITIRVDLNRALRDRRENILIKANDVVILQFTPAESLARYFTSVFSYNFFGTIIRQQDLTATTNLTGF